MTEFEIEFGVLKKYNGEGGRVVIPEGVMGIGAEVFCRHTNLTEIVLPESLVLIGEKAFYFCDLIKEVIIPDSVEEIASDAFMHCIGLEHVKFPSNLNRIGDRAFKFCKLLDNVELPDTVKYIGEEAFFRTKWLKEKEDEFVVVGSGCLIAFNGDKKSTVIIPEEVELISGLVFKSVHRGTIIQGNKEVLKQIEEYYPTLTFEYDESYIGIGDTKEFVGILV